MFFEEIINANNSNNDNINDININQKSLERLKSIKDISFNSEILKNLKSLLDLDPRDDRSLALFKLFLMSNL